MNFPDVEKTWYYGFWVSVGILFALTYLLLPITDPDFFWHLHTGQWIWEHRSLPTTDPFGMLGGGTVDARQYFILTSYWLAQLFYYFIYTFLGWGGFFAVRAMFLLFLIMALLARDHVWRFGYAVLTATYLIILFARFPVERPQFFSFLAFAVMLVLLDRLAKSGNAPLPRHVAWGLPALMLLWANLHGGIILGQILCVAHLLNNVWLHFTGKGNGKFPLAGSAVLVVALLFSFVSPNAATYFAAHQEFHDPKYKVFYDLTTEYRSISVAILENKAWIYGFFPAITVLALFWLLRDGLRKNLMYLVLVALFSFYAFKHVRYLPFLGALVLPFAGNAVTLISRKVAAVFLVATGLLCIVATSSHFENIRKLANYGPVSGVYPKNAVEFVKQKGFQGKVLNDFFWGGYLGWALGPGHNIFVDGRTLDDERFKDYTLITQMLAVAEQGAEKHIDYYGKGKILDHFLRKYKIDYMILPKMRGGKPFWLATTIASHSDWKMVYNDPLSVVFVKRDRVPAR